MTETDHPSLVPERELAGVQSDGDIRRARMILLPEEGLRPQEQDEVGHHHRPLEDAMTVHHVPGGLGLQKGDTVPRTRVDPGRIAQIRNTVEDSWIAGKLH